MSIRPRLSPTMDRFIAAHFFGPFLVCLAAFTVAYLLGDIFDRFNDLIQYGGFGLLGLEYFMLKLPLIVSQLLPVASLAGVLLGFALLNRTGEVLACQQLGISRLEMAVPVLVIAALISVFDFAISETVVPAATRQAQYLYQIELQKRKLFGIFFNRRIWVRVRDGFMSADYYDARHKMLHGVTFYAVSPDYSLGTIAQAPSASWNGHRWTPNGVSAIKLGPNNSIVPAADVTFDIDAKPKDFSLLKMDPDEFSLWQLDSYIKGLREKGLDPGGYLVDRDLKYAMPLACLIMASLGLALSLDPLPRNVSVGRSFGLAIAIGFGYWLMFGLTSSFGRSMLIPAWLAAWFPNMTFAILGSALFLFGEER
ncbi:MAG TPA: LptF/LptG family permease [Candidatus Binataceae bacterium]|nr:LptF/LptG family permease [Candidatus Binataceae bacterium]